MEKPQPIPQKGSSFSTIAHHDDKPSSVDRSLSADHAKAYVKKERDPAVGDTINDEDEEEDKQEREREENGKEREEVEQEAQASFVAAERSTRIEPDVNYTSASAEVDEFIGVLLAAAGQAEPPPFAESAVGKFLDIVEGSVIKHEAGEYGLSIENGGFSLFDAIDRMTRLTSAAEAFTVDPTYNEAVNRAGSILHRAMCFLEEEFHALLDDPKLKQQDPGGARSKPKKPPSFGLVQELTQLTTSGPMTSGLMTSETNYIVAEPQKKYPPEAVEMLRRIASGMISGGYATECCQVFTIARRNAFDAGLLSLGYEKLSVDDVVRMPWEALETEMATWIKVFRQSVEVTFAREHNLCEAIFPGHSYIAFSIFHNLARGAIIPLLTFAEAIAVTKRSAEKLFKVLEMYEALRDMMPKIDALLQCPDSVPGESSYASVLDDLEVEIESARSRLGDTAVAIFFELENSIKNDTGKTIVPGGAVHPLTRYVMNYLKYGCEYKSTMEQVFRENKNSGEKPAAPLAVENGGGGGGGGEEVSSSEEPNPFAAKLVEVMDLLHASLETKSKLYKDPSLVSIFLMNNGRYIMQKIKGSSKIHPLLGDAWCRKQTSELRQYHKNYQRETWSRVLGCFKEAGLQGKSGGVAKPALKERFKSFNSMFEEIHKTQSMWLVSDEQLQSELRVSISAVIVPAYRSFLGRYSQYLDAGRQTEKYIKFGPDELENYIDELFSGNASSMVSRRR